MGKGKKKGGKGPGPDQPKESPAQPSTSSQGGTSEGSGKSKNIQKSEQKPQDTGAAGDTGRKQFPSESSSDSQRPQQQQQPQKSRPSGQQAMAPGQPKQKGDGGAQQSPQGQPMSPPGFSPVHQQGGPQGQQQQQRGPQGQQQQQRGPQGQQQQGRGPQGQKQQQRGPQGQQQQQRGPQGQQQQQRGPQGQQQQQRGPQGQQQQQRGPQGQQQQQRGPQGQQQQQRGPQVQQQQGQGPQGQQQQGRGPQGHQQTGQGPQGQQQAAWGPPGQPKAAWGPQGQPQAAWGPQGQQQPGQGPQGRQPSAWGQQGQQQPGQGPQGRQPSAWGQQGQQQPGSGPQGHQQAGAQQPSQQQSGGRGQGQQPAGQGRQQQQRGSQAQQQATAAQERSLPGQAASPWGQPKASSPPGQQAAPGSTQRQASGSPEVSQAQVSSKSQPGGKQQPAAKTPAGDLGRSTILSLSDQMNQMSLIKKKNVVPGTKGRRILIETNHLRLDLGKLKVAYHYDVQMIPDTPKKMLRDVMEQFRQIHFPKRHPAFDGRKNLYSPIKLMEHGEELSSEIKIADQMNERERIFKVTVKYANDVDLSPLHSLMTVLTPQEAVQCVEIVLRSAPSVRCIQAGRSFFTRPPQIINLGEGMEMYQGFYQSVVRGWKPLLNVDVAHKAFPKQANLIDVIIEVCSTYYEKLTGAELQRNPLTWQQIETLTKFLRTLRVVYEIPGQPGSKREYKVNGVKGNPREQKFNPDNGPLMTIEEYFQRKKNYRLHYPLMPTIWVGSMQRKDPILLPAELCTIVPGQVVNRKMTENQTSSMIRTAATSTTIRKQKIMTSLQNTQHNQNLCIREFGFSIGDDFEQIQARILDPPMLSYDNSTKSVGPSKGVWRSDNVRFQRGATINKWTIVNACGSRDTDKLADMIYSFAPKCGMTLNSRADKPYPELRGKQPTVKDITDCLRKYASTFDLLFVLIPDSGPTYSNVKKVAEINIGCLTQCIKRRTMNKLSPPTVNNILLKVNSKMNGVNHVLRSSPPILQKPCMVMGADVTHPSPDSQNIPSVAAVTASFDPKAYCYNIACRLQSPRAEIIADLENITYQFLWNFHERNRGQKPYSIVFFRDGVSEGQFCEVLNQEVRAIRNACMRLNKEYQPKITFLVVQKRHHTRFFPKNPRDSDDRNVNVPAGTCVDTTITNPMIQDFYLVSHASIQGVAKPTKYCTLSDDNDMSNDDIEELTYHLCYLFSRCNRSVSYPAPTYYAHLAAARAKVYIENDNVDVNNLDREQRRINIQPVIKDGKPMFFV